MPSKDQFPIFRDPSEEDMRDPRLFFRKLLRRCQFHNVPKEYYVRKVLVACMPNDPLAQWVEDNIILADLSWDEAMVLFTVIHTDTQLENQLLDRLAKLSMHG